MRGYGYVLAAYLGAAALYGSYALRLWVQERALERRRRGRSR